MADKYSEGYRIAVKRIKTNSKTRVVKLDLSGLELTSLPPTIIKLKHLQYLDLGIDEGNTKRNYIEEFPKEILELEIYRNYILIIIK